MLSLGSPAVETDVYKHKFSLKKASLITTMEASSTFLKATPFGFRPIISNSTTKHSFRHFNKHIKVHQPNFPINSFHNHRHIQLLPIKSTHPISLQTRRLNLLNPIKCADTDTAMAPQFGNNPLSRLFNGVSFDSAKVYLSGLTPIDVCRCIGVLSIVVAVTKRCVDFVLNPFVWMYFSWTWLFWPWYVAIALAVYGFYAFRRHLRGEASLVEQLGIVTSTFTWLTLVPPACCNGFLEGWPFVFFFVYHYFFFLNVTVRKHLYGDYNARPHDPKWDITLPNWQKLLFCVGVMVAHWYAAFEGPELHLLPGGWNNAAVWGLILVTVFMQYNSTMYLAKYSEKVVVPTSVVQFGPYRWVRHPIYASTMLLFVTYFAALRAPLSSLFVVAVCLLYYGQKAKLEEALMLDTFGERYAEYANKVRHKFIPFVY